MTDHGGNVVPGGDLAAQIIRKDGTVENIVRMEPPPVTDDRRLENARRLGLDETVDALDAELGAELGDLLPLYIADSYVGAFKTSAHGRAHVLGVCADEPERLSAFAREVAYSSTSHGGDSDPYIAR